MSYRTTTSAVADGATTVSLPSTGVLSGDRLFAFIAFRGAAITPPSGWTQLGAELLIYNNTGTPLNARARVYERTAGGSETATYDFVIGNANDHVGIMVALKDVTGTAVVSTLTNTTDSATIAAASVTAAAISDLICFVAQTSQTTFTAPGTMTERADVTTGGGSDATAATAATQEGIAAGATGTRTFTDVNGGGYPIDRMVAFTIAVQQAPTTMSVASNKAASDAAGGGSAERTGVNLTDCEVYGTISTLPAAGKVARLWWRRNESSGTGYYLEIEDGVGARLVVFNGTSGATIATYTHTPGAGDTYGARMTGTTISCHRKPAGGTWEQLGGQTDATYSSGTLAMSITDNVGRIDDFGGGIPVTVTTDPVITGTAEQGQVLTLSSLGAYTGSPAAYSYQWQRGGSSAWADISAATDAVYTLAAGDVALNVRCVVTATNTTNGVATAISNDIGPVGGTATPPVDPPVDPPGPPAPEEPPAPAEPGEPENRDPGAAPPGRRTLRNYWRRRYF